MDTAGHALKYLSQHMGDPNPNVREERVREIGHAITDLWILMDDQRGLTRAIEASIFTIQEQLDGLAS